MRILSGKRLELLKETVPRLTHAALLTLGGNRGDQDELRETRAAAKSLGVQIQALQVRDRSQFQSAFGAMSKERAKRLS
jgi:hypothetical protein